MSVFGRHLHLDFFSSSERLNDVPFIEEVLSEMVELLGTRKLCEPVVIHSDCSNPKWDPPDATGLSGFVVLAESHVSIHTFAEAGFVFLDAFSCKDFHFTTVHEYVDDKFGASKLDATLTSRGHQFPLAKNV